MVASQGPRGRGARARTTSTTWASPAWSRACSRCPTARCGSSCTAPSAWRSRSSSRTEPYLVAAHRGGAGRDRRPRPSSRRSTATCRRPSRSIIEQVPYLPEELQIAVANLDDPAELAHMIAGALRIKTEEKQALLEERDVAKRLRRLSELLARELELVAIGSKIQSQVQSEMDRGPARVLPAPAAEGDPGGARRGRRAAGRGARAARADRGGRAARARPQAGRARAGALRAAAAAVGGARRDPHLPRVDRHAALVAASPRTTST